MTASRGLVRSMLIIGGAQSAGILIAIVRLKLLALMLGPAGVGLLSIYTSLMETAKQAGGLGLESSGVRELASKKGEADALSRVRVVLIAAHFVQGALAMAVVWLLRVPLAELLFDDPARATEVGLVGVAVLLSLIAASQTALLQGLRQIGDLGQVTVFGAAAGTAAGLVAVWLRGEDGLIWFVIVQPLASALVAFWFTKRLPELKAARLALREAWHTWKPMASLGAVFMLGGLATTATLLAVRGMIANDLGLAEAGFFAAAWSITMQYVGFLLGAMSADFYPRLTEVIRDRDAATRLMNDQIQLGLAMGGPVLVLLIGLAPWVIELLYSGDFGPAAELLQWQTLGNVFKLACWPLGFAFVAAARSRVFLIAQLEWNVVFLGLLWLGLPVFGLEIAGTAFLAAYVLHFWFISFLARRLQGFRWAPLSLTLLASYAALSVLAFLLAKSAPIPAAAASVLLAFGGGVVGLRIVLAKIGPEGKIAAGLAGVYAKLGWPVKYD